jgi:hypothetical protein
LRTSDEQEYDDKPDEVVHTNQWTFDSKHAQTIGEKASFTSDLRFVSSDVAPKAVSQLDDVRDVIDRRIESRMSLRKSWSSVGFSASARRTQILDPTPSPNTSVQRVFTQLPNISLSIPSRSLYFGSNTVSGRETVTQKVLESIRYSPGLSMNRATEERIFNQITEIEGGVQARVYPVDEETINGNASLSFSAPFRLMFLNLSPRLSANDAYTRVTVTQREHELISMTEDDTTRTLIPETSETTSDNRFNWNTGVGATTNFFGTFFPRIGSLRGIRHTISPSVTYSYQPSVSGRPSSQRFGVNLKNAFDLKVLAGSQRKITPGDVATPHSKGGLGGVGNLPTEEGEGIEQGQDAGEDEEEKLRKLSGVLIWTLNSSYNPDAASKKGWTTIASLVNLRVIGINFSVNNSIDPYTLDVESTRLTSGISLAGKHPFGSAAEAAAPELNIVARDSSDAGGVDEPYPGQDSDDDDETRLPWSVSMAFSYSKSDFGDPSSTMNLNGNISLTQNWKISYRTTYDVVGREFLGEFISVTRDLHCWEMSLARQKLGDEWEFYFRINLKAHQELYAEQGNRGLGGGTFGRY